MKRLLLLSVLLWPLQSVGEVKAQVAFIGTLQELVLIPRNRNACPEPVSPTGGVVVANFCGCGTATFEIIESTHPSPDDIYVVHFRVGEWCEPNVRIFQEAKFLVYKA